MLEKACKTCGCPLFEVKGKTLCVVCAENAIAAKDAPAAATTAVPPSSQHARHEPAHEHIHEHGPTCTCGGDHDEEPCTCDESGLTEELAFTIHSLCLRIQNEKDPNHVLTLMEAVKEGTDALETLCRL